MNLYKKPLSSSQYCHTEEEAVTNIHKLAHIRMDFRGIMQSAWTRKG